MDVEYRCNVKERYFCTKDGTAIYREALRNANGIRNEPFMNFWPELVELKQVDDGFTVRDRVIFRAYRGGVYEPPVELEKKDMIGNQPHAKFSPACRIFRGSGNIPRCGELMEMQCEEANTRRVYAHTGWKMIDGKRVFLNGGYSVTADGLTDQYTVELDPDLARCYRFVPFSGENACGVTMSMYQLIPDFLVVPSLAYVFLSPLNEMLRTSGGEPCFSLYFIGKTGSYKSSWSKVLLGFFGQLGYAETAPITFLDTENAIGRKLGLGADIPLLLDDRRPTSNARDKLIYESKEKFVSSAIGDRAARGRLNADSTAKVSYIARCNLIVTAEEAFQNIGSSAIARSVSVELEPTTIQHDKLQVLQESTAALNKTMQLYLQWVIQNYDEIKHRSGETLRQYRDYFSNAGHARLATAFSQMMFGYTQFLRFMTDQEQLDNERAEQMAKRALDIFREMCEQQSRKVEREKPTLLFVELLKEMLETKQCSIADIGDNPSQLVKPNIIGYRDNDYLYLIGNTAYSAVRQFYAKQGNEFPSSTINLWKMFRDEGKLIPDVTGNRVDKRKRISGKSGRYIWLRADLLDEKESEENTDE